LDSTFFPISIHISASIFISVSIFISISVSIFIFMSWKKALLSVKREEVTRHGTSRTLDGGFPFSCQRLPRGLLLHRLDIPLRLLTKEPVFLRGLPLLLFLGRHLCRAREELEQRISNRTHRLLAIAYSLL
jgi:hypothetical protein